MRKKKVIVISIILILAVFSVIFIEDEFSRPYRTVEKLVNDFRNNRNISKYIIEKKNDNWIDIKNKSKYNVVAKDIDWLHLKELLEDKKVSRIECNRKYSLGYKIKNYLRREADTVIHTYDFAGNELSKMRILMIKVDNTWKVIGTANDKDIGFLNDSEISPFDIEAYLKDNNQGNKELLYEKLNIHSDLFDSEYNKIEIADKINTNLVDEKFNTVLLLLKQRVFYYQFLVFNKETDDYNFVGNIDFGYKNGIGPSFRIEEIDNKHKYIVIKTQTGYGTGINEKSERWYRIGRDKITKVLEYPVDFVHVPPEKVSYPIKISGKVIKSKIIDGKPTVEVDFTISYICDINNDKFADIDKTARYTLEGNQFVSNEYGIDNNWMYREEINNEMLDKNFQKLMKVSESDDESTINYLHRFLEACGESNNKKTLLDKIKS